MEPKRYVLKIRTGGIMRGQLLIDAENHRKRMEWKKKLRSLPRKCMKEDSESESDMQVDEDINDGEGTSKDKNEELPQPSSSSTKTSQKRSRKATPEKSKQV